MGRAADTLIDLTSGINYGRSKDECADHEEALTLQAEEELDIDLEVEDTSRKEYIFLIDRSGSMTYTIGLAREALTLFLYSLPAGSKFNVCSYGSTHQFMFSERSVDYNDQNLAIAVA